jgi:hypothetical protein
LPAAFRRVFLPPSGEKAKLPLRWCEREKNRLAMTIGQSCEIAEALTALQKKGRGRSRSGLRSFVIVSRCRPDGQPLQPFGQQFELLACAELVQAVNADLNRLDVVVGDTVDVFGAVV